MTDRLTIALAQLNPTVGDVDGNADMILAARDEAAGQGADLVVCTELVLIGYPPEDLVLKPALQDRAEKFPVASSIGSVRAGKDKAVAPFAMAGAADILRSQVGGSTM